MITMTRLFTLAVLSTSLATAGGAALRADDMEYGVTVMKPSQAVDRDFGSTHTVSYFLGNDGKCLLTLSISDVAVGDVATPSKPVRYEIAINSGETRGFNANATTSLQFTCHDNGKAMFLQPENQEQEQAEINPWGDEWGAE
ncbi:MAG: hypothetical protein AB7U75_04495 [Hyphomicrobiaceae bacterium]